MMGVMSPSSKRLLELLADGEWHDRSTVVEATMPLIEPGRAYRACEAMRNRATQRPNGPGPRVRGDDATSIAAGSRYLAMQRLLSLTGRGRLEQRTVDGTIQVRAVAR